ncbi:MAG TPA: cobalamin-dependent protein, partial [Kofleriaceae bacterium]|nr:cobalamin-dependent protein [Kofleriaceae bacterium]
MTSSVLISEPCNESPYYPYMWGVLKSYCEVVAGITDELRWLDPIYLRSEDHAREIEDHAQGGPVDVLGLSCYIWNWDYQVELARAMKQRNPDCLVVAGGPHPEYKDREFFRNHPEIDIVVLRDGEIPFSRILRRRLEGERGFDDIPGLVLRDSEGNPRSTGAAEVPQSFPYSPWIVQTAFYERLAAERGPGFHSAVWETNRGCPYSCRFCDWGSSTMSKLRLMDTDRLRAEVDWFARTQTEFIFNVDANFGILERDVQLTEWVVAAFERHGYPRSFNYSAAKNN